MFKTHLRGGKAFAAEQKIKDLEKILYKAKTIEKRFKNKRLKPTELILKLKKNINNARSEKYSFEAETIVKSNLFRMKYNFHRLIKVKKDEERHG